MLNHYNNDIIHYKGDAITYDNNFNGINTMGVYSVGDTQSFSNAPGSADNGYLYVFASGSEKIRQIWVGLYSFGFSTRYYNNGHWSQWTSIV